MIRFIGNYSFYVIGFLILWFIDLCVIITMYSSSFLWVFYFCLLFLKMEVVSPPSVLVVYLSDLSIDGVLVPLSYLDVKLVVTHVLLSFDSGLIGKFHQLSGFCQKEPYMCLIFSVPRLYPLSGLKHMSFLLSVIRFHWWIRFYLRVCLM